MADRPELRRILAALAAMPGRTRASWEERRRGMELTQARLGLPDDVECEPADADGVPVEWIRTPRVSRSRILLYFHGGGYTVGSINTHRFLMQALGRAAAATVLGVDYRLAPESPFPAGLDDALAAWRWLLAGGAEAKDVVIAGDSAGGGLSLAALVRLRDAGSELPAAAVCLSPWTDLERSLDPSVDNDDPIATREILRTMAAAYVGADQATNPLSSPVNADLAGLPPLLIQVGGAEHLLADSTRLAARARSAGVEVTLEEWEDMIHVFQFFPSLPDAKLAIDRIGEFIREMWSCV